MDADEIIKAIESIWAKTMAEIEAKRQQWVKEGKLVDEVTCGQDAQNKLTFQMFKENKMSAANNEIQMLLADKT
jgi:hypothetical protein